MKKVIEAGEKVCVKAVHLMWMVIFAVFTFWAGRYTYCYPENYEEQYVTGVLDSPVGNCLVVIAALLAASVIRLVLLRGTEEQKRKRVRWFAVVTVILAGILLAVWVTICHIMPMWDQMQVYQTAVAFRGGEYRDMRFYMYMYPQQYTLTFLYELVFGIWESYHLIQYINVLFVMLLLWFSYLVCDELFHNQTVNLYCIVAMTLFLPMHFYVNYVYGDVGHIAMCMAAIWGILRWGSRGKNGYGVLAVVCMTLAVLLRKNTLVILIAAMIVLLIYGLKQQNWRAAVLAVILLAVPLVSIELIQFSYEKRSGMEIDGGIPAVMWIAMGMQQSGNGAGAFNGYSESHFWGLAEADTDTAAAIGKAYIEGRLQEFSIHPEVAFQFYKSKLQEQWNEPTLGSMVMTSVFESEPQGIVKEVYYGGTRQGVLKYMDRYLFLIYLGALLYSTGALFREKGILQCITMIGVIGGVLFSILWETKSRYVLSYVILLIPYMVHGIYDVQEIALRLWNKAKERYNGRNIKSAEKADEAESPLLH